jgi:predicted RND superfamily exporter protein
VSLDLELISGRLVRWLIRARSAVLVTAGILTAVGTYFAVHLYQDLRSDVEALLPVNAPSVVAAKTVGPLLHNVTHLSVVLEGSDPDALEHFADDLAARLRRLPPTMVETVDYRTDEEQAFLKRFGLLYLSTQDLRTILARIQRRVAWEKRNANPLLGLVNEEREPPPPLDFSDIEAKYSNDQRQLSRFRSGYFQTPDGHLLAMIIRPPEAGTGYRFNKSLWEEVKQQVQQLDPHHYDSTMKVGYDGDLAGIVEEQEALVEDLASSTLVVVTLVLGALWIYFRRWAAIVAILGALVVGCAVTFGLSYFLIGHLNANSAFLGSIVVGNGINVPIIIVARYMEERRGGLSVAEAARISLSRTFGATFVAAFASGLAYLSLSLTAFRGFREFGIIGGLGMSLCWLSAIILLPPLLSIIERWRPLNIQTTARSLTVSSRLVQFVQRHRRAIRRATVLSLVAVLVGILAYRGELIEYDLSKLRARRSIKSGSIYWGHKFDQIFNAYLTPIVIVGATREVVDHAVAVLNQKRRELGTSDPIREVRTLRTVIPDNQEEKIRILGEVRTALSDERLALLPPDQREKAEKYRPPADLRPVTLEDVPKALRLPLTLRDGTAGRVALVFPRKVGILDSRDLEQLSSLIRGSISGFTTKAQAVGQALLFSDILSAIVTDGPKATGLALFAAMAIVFVVLRHLRPAFTVLSGLLLGVAWLVGAAAFAGLRVNFLNFVVLPITFGIGVDYSVNIIQRYRLEGASSLTRVLRETGGAVALCSSTTIIGYSSLFVAENRALAGFGLLASLGELSCLAAALIALPAWLLGHESELLRDRGR